MITSENLWLLAALVTSGSTGIYVGYKWCRSNLVKMLKLHCNFVRAQIRYLDVQLEELDYASTQANPSSLLQSLKINIGYIRRQSQEHLGEMEKLVDGKK